MSQKKPLFSVIIPAYNTAEYVEECVASVQRQTYPNWEIMLVDDGSTDATGRICQAMEQADKRIQYIHKRHAGAAAARNVGMQASSGEYLFFLDSDDTIYPRLFEEMYWQITEHSPDLLTCGYLCVRGSMPAPQINGDVDGWHLVEERLSAAFFHEDYKIMQGTGGKAIRRVAMEGLCFDETLTAVEDGWFLYQLAMRKVRIAYTRTKWYYYRMCSESTTHSMNMSHSMATLTVRKRICRNELERGNPQWAEQWENIMIGEIRSMYKIARKQKDIAWIRYLQKEYITILQKSPFQQNKPIRERLSEAGFFLAYPLYKGLIQLKQRIGI